MGDHGAAMLWLAAFALLAFEALAVFGAAAVARLKLSLRAGTYALIASTPAPLGMLILAPRLASHSSLLLDLACAALALFAGGALAGYALRWLMPQAGNRVWRFGWAIAAMNALLLTVLWYAQMLLHRLPA